MLITIKNKKLKNKKCIFAIEIGVTYT